MANNFDFSIGEQGLEGISTEGGGVKTIRLVSTKKGFGDIKELGWLDSISVMLHCETSGVTLKLTRKDGSSCDLDVDFKESTFKAMVR